VQVLVGQEFLDPVILLPAPQKVTIPEEEEKYVPNKLPVYEVIK
jgi:hypothetical protein